MFLYILGTVFHNMEKQLIP